MPLIARLRVKARDLWDEDFVITSRAGHSFALAPDLASYCAAGQFVVSETDDAQGFVEWSLAERGLSRQVALTVPGFFMALAVVAAMDLLAAVPRRFAKAHGAGLVITEPPLSLPRFPLKAVLPKANLVDASLAWFLTALASTAP